MDSPHSSWACVYDLAYERSFGDFLKRLTDETLALVREKVRIPAKIIDFGAGTGRLSVPLAEDGYDVVAVEPCCEMLAQLHQKAQGATSKITPVLSRMRDFPGLCDCDFALCVFTVVAYLLERNDLNSSIQAVSRSLKAGGYFLIDVPERGLFNRYRCQADDFSREVIVTEAAKDLFKYHDKLTVGEPGKKTFYEDEFFIRYWPMEEIAQALEQAGFQLVENCSKRFGGSGAHYLLLWKKPDVWQPQ